MFVDYYCLCDSFDRYLADFYLFFFLMIKSDKLCNVNMWPNTYWHNWQVTQLLLRQCIFCNSLAECWKNVLSAFTRWHKHLWFKKQGVWGDRFCVGVKCCKIVFLGGTSYSLVADKPQRNRCKNVSSLFEIIMRMLTEMYRNMNDNPLYNISVQINSWRFTRRRHSIALCSVSGRNQHNGKLICYLLDLFYHVSWS